MRTSFGRIFTTAAILLLISLLAVGMSLRALVKDYLRESSVQSLQNDAKVIADLASAYYTGGSMSDMQFLTNLDIASRVSDADAVICDGAGRIVLCSDSLQGCRHQGLIVDEGYLLRVIENKVVADTGMVGGLYEEARYVVSVPIETNFGSIGMVMVSTPMSAAEGILARISDIYVMVSLLVVTACGILMTFFARLQGRPLREMAKAANEFGHGELTARVPIREDYPDDVAELALAFNNMAASLEKSEYQRQEFVANVSHELKTPMTTIGGYIDGILDGTIPPERSRHYMQIVSDETKRLSRLVRSMLDISRLQDQKGIPEEKKSRFDLEECMGQVLITFEKKITDKKLNVEVDMPAYPVFTHACQDHITQVIYNLIDNAVKFCPAEGTVSLSIRTSGSKAYISVSNDGKTIPAEELPLLFDRFHKLDKSRSQNRDGWGLGLYIVKTIVCSHGEDISVASKNGQTTFTFTMPLVN